MISLTNPEAPSVPRVVSRPISEAQLRDPRGYQIEALRKRFKPKESTTASGATSLVFKLKPSDPDFPFELDALDCDVRVPEAYPESRPELLVRNRDMPRGFGINVERGFGRLAEEKKGASLLALVYALDRNLEGFLSEQKAETVKLVAFKDTRHLDAEKERETETENEKDKSVEHVEPQQAVIEALPYIPEPSYSREQIAEAKARRAQEIRQLESRMGRMPQFRRSADGVIFTLPIEPKRRSDLPPGLQQVATIHLIVPLLYPLQQLRIQLNEADASDAEPVEDLFAERAAEQKQMSLMSHVNHLVQNLHNLSKQARARAEAPSVPETCPSQEPSQEGAAALDPSASERKSHIQVIQRPPEWMTAADGDESGDDTSSDEDEDEDEGGAELHGEAATTKPLPETPEHGTMISFPLVELHGIELLQVSSLSITVRCERCKTPNDMASLTPGTQRTSRCRKCAIPLAAQFHPQLVHEHSIRAGFIDLSGCKVADMLPSTFTPTCAKCSHAGAGLVSVRGETTTNVCRECHARFTFKIPQVKFLFVSPGSLAAAPAMAGPRRKQERLGLHAGEPLPDRGACEHYRKSYRWFRFSCCSRVHPCDRCHDGAEDHPNEWANRMICGLCSREQNYAVEACVFCGRSVIGKKGRGFWEGGKGTRDQRMMSKKDPRKYKRIGSAKKD